MLDKMKPERRKFRQETVIHSYIVRPLAQEIVLLLWNTKITPNQLTLIRSILSIIYLYLFFIGTNLGFIIGIFLFELAEIIDHADGMLARMKNQTSKLGQYYEYITDELFAAEHGLLGLVIAYGVYQHTSNIVFLYLAVLIIFFYYFTQYIKITINPNQITTKMEFNHDKEEMIKILNVSFKDSLRNLVKTIFIWRNQLFFIGLLYLIFQDEYVLLLIYILFLMLNILKLMKQLTIGYVKNQE
jgi:phosphatidylglycerophosphate synthase